MKKIGNIALYINNVLIFLFINGLKSFIYLQLNEKYNNFGNCTILLQSNRDMKLKMFYQAFLLIKKY